MKMKKIAAIGLVAILVFPILAKLAKAQDTIYLRYSTKSYWSLDWAHSPENSKWIFPEIGFAKNPFSEPDYQEVWFGGGYSLIANDRLIFIPLGYILDASDATYLQPAFFFQANWKKLEFSTIAYQYIPLEKEGISQTVIDPAKVFLNLNDKIAAGGNFHFYKAEGGEWQIKSGPAVRWKVNKSLTGEAVFWDGPYTDPEIQIKLEVRF